LLTLKGRGGLEVKISATFISVRKKGKREIFRLLVGEGGPIVHPVEGELLSNHTPRRGEKVNCGKARGTLLLRRNGAAKKKSISDRIRKKEGEKNNRSAQDLKSM